MNSVKQPTNSPKLAAPLLAGVVFSLIWLAAGALLLSLLLHFTGMQESELGAYTMGVHGLAALAGGLASGKRSERKGWYNGGMLGLMYGILIIIVSFLATNASVTWHSALVLALAVLAAAFGGMIGVNLKR